MPLLRSRNLHISTTPRSKNQQGTSKRVKNDNGREESDQLPSKNSGEESQASMAEIIRFFKIRDRELKEKKKYLKEQRLKELREQKEEMLQREKRWEDLFKQSVEMAQREQKN